MRYALLVYGNADVREAMSDDDRKRVNAGVAEVLERHNISDLLRLQDVSTATTVRYRDGRSLMTDGPFVESKDYLGGFILVEAEDLDGALAVVSELHLWSAGAIEVRPVLEEPLVGA